MRYIAVVLCVTMTIVCAHAQDAGVLKLPQDMEFKGPLSGPPQTAVLYGDPTKPGLFVTRVKFSAGWKDAPHWHPERFAPSQFFPGHSISDVVRSGMRASLQPTPRDVLL